MTMKKGLTLETQRREDKIRLSSSRLCVSGVRLIECYAFDSSPRST
jgi:hypothetical protein